MKRDLSAVDPLQVIHFSEENDRFTYASFLLTMEEARALIEVL